MNKRFFEVMQGNSGRWMAREVYSIYHNGRVDKAGGWVFSGHAPKCAEQDAIILRQLGRQIKGEIPSHINRLRGGSESHVTMTGDDKLEMNWKWDVPETVF